MFRSSSTPAPRLLLIVNITQRVMIGSLVSRHPNDVEGSCRAVI
jgi:hypothetical protein